MPIAPEITVRQLKALLEHAPDDAIVRSNSWRLTGLDIIERRVRHPRIVEHTNAVPEPMIICSLRFVYRNDEDDSISE